jgi:hypothetical protein
MTQVLKFLPVILLLSDWPSALCMTSHSPSTWSLSLGCIRLAAGIVGIAGIVDTIVFQLTLDIVNRASVLGATVTVDVAVTSMVVVVVVMCIQKPRYFPNPAL